MSIWYDCTNVVVKRAKARAEQMLAKRKEDTVVCCYREDKTWHTNRGQSMHYLFPREMTTTLKSIYGQDCGVTSHMWQSYIIELQNKCNRNPLQLRRKKNWWLQRGYIFFLVKEHAQKNAELRERCTEYAQRHADTVVKIRKESWMQLVLQRHHWFRSE